MSWLVDGMSTFLDGAFFPHVLIEEAGLRVERRAEPVCCAIIVRVYNCPSRARHCRRVEVGPAALIQPTGPILSRKFLAHEKLASQPVQHVVKAIPVSEQDQFPGPAAEVDIQ